MIDIWGGKERNTNHEERKRGRKQKARERGKL